MSSRIKGSKSLPTGFYIAIPEGRKDIAEKFNSDIIVKESCQMKDGRKAFIIRMPDHPITTQRIKEDIKRNF